MIEFLASYAPGVFAWLTLPAIMFSIGIYGVLTRRNAVGILISAELAINAAAMNFVIFNKFIAPVPLSALWILATYWLAQGLIAGSLRARAGP